MSALTSRAVIENDLLSIQPELWFKYCIFLVKTVAL